MTAPEPSSTLVDQSQPHDVRDGPEAAVLNGEAGGNDLAVFIPRQVYPGAGGEVVQSPPLSHTIEGLRFTIGTSSARRR
jgi:hypothetical protein